MFLETIAMMGGNPQAAGGGMQMIITMALVFGLMYFMLIKPQQRKEKERRKMISELKSGTRVMFSGGIIGTVTNIKEHTFIIKVSDNTKLEVLKGSINKVFEKGEKISGDDKK